MTKHFFALIAAISILLSTVIYSDWKLQDERVELWRTRAWDERVFVSEHLMGWIGNACVYGDKFGDIKKLCNENKGWASATIDYSTNFRCEPL